MYKVIDLFAGAGGLSLGFKQTGKFEIVAAAENNANAKKTYRRNHPNVDLRDDVKKIDYSEIKNTHGTIDVVIGGPPCQGFSNANRQKAHTISMNNALVKEYVRAIRELKPRVFVMENVGMLKSEVHRFYYSYEDKASIDSLGFELRSDELELLPHEFSNGNEQQLLQSLSDYSKYLWSEKEYLAIKVLYRQRNNSEKFNNTIKKHKTVLKKMVNRIIARKDSIVDVAFNAEYVMSKAIKPCLDVPQNDCTKVANTIETPLMIQKMYRGYSELIDNKIVIKGFSSDNGICAKVLSFPVHEYIKKMLQSAPYSYSINSKVLNAANYGAPQKRERYIVIGVRNGEKPPMPIGEYETNCFRTVREAIEDLQDIKPSFDIEAEPIKLDTIPIEPKSLLSSLRDSETLSNHVITQSRKEALERFAALNQGENFHDLDEKLKSTYANSDRTQNTIYLRLKYDEPSGTVVNVRKSMWIHPTKDRALSIREAARLQTFPDSFIFEGNKDAQYQQVGNAVPPILAYAIARAVLNIFEQ